MIFEPENAQYLKPWLVRTLEPICDAEPGALADYVLALLKHNVPEGELRKEMQVQLDEFLEKECLSFLSTLFSVLRSKSYLPYSASPSTNKIDKLDNGIPIPLDALLSPSTSTSPDRIRKRSLETDDRDQYPPSKGPRLSADGRYNNNRSGQPGAWGGRDRSMNGYSREMMQQQQPYMNGMGMNGRRGPAYQPPEPKRGVCRDYHNTGYCARGAFCKYSHGEDAMVPQQFYAMNNGMQPGIPMMPSMYPNGYGMGNGGGAYDPHEARMDMRPMNGVQGRTSLIPRDNTSRLTHSMQSSGELPVIQDLTPNISASDLRPNPQNQGHNSSIPLPHMQNEQLNAQLPSIQLNQPFQRPYSEDVEMLPPQARPFPNHRGSGRSSRGGRVPGTFHSDAVNFRPEKRRDKTLVMEKIPDDKLSLEQVNDWFKRFGTVTNVAIDRDSAKALISFSTHEEAHTAWKSEDAVFNNRFVKLFWHRPMEGHGQVGTRALAASAPAVASLGETSPQPPAQSKLQQVPTTSTPLTQKVPSASSVSSLAAKHKILERQITEQKTLMTSLDSASPEEKKTIMARLRKLGEEMSSTSTTSEFTAPAANVDPEQNEKDRLDKELELHSVAHGDGESGSAEALKAKLEQLKAEAASLGIDTSNSSTTSTYRPYRGRGRVSSRGYYRGGPVRGGPPRSSMKLDNRPKKLLVKGVNSEQMQALQDWYETTGQVNSFSPLDNGDTVVSFKTRAAAEQGLSKGQKIPLIGTIQVSWYSGSNSGAKVIVSKPSEDTEMRPPETTSSVQEEPNSSSHIMEEEVIASGWGGDGEDGMGML